MRKLLAIAALSLAGMAGWGCGSTGCGHLKALCNACTDANKKQACLNIVQTYQSAGPAGDMACDSVDSQYQNCEGGT